MSNETNSCPEGCGEISAGDTGFMIMATTFVMLQTPGMGLCQAGIIRRKNSLSMLMQVLTGFTVGSVLWFLFGFSLTFGPTVGGFIGNFHHAFLMNMKPECCYPIAPSIPSYVFVMFQMMFAVMTPVVVTGAWAERMTFKAFLVWCTLWPILVYYPLAHWVWNPNGWLAAMGVADFAGGITIHTCSGTAALAVTKVLQVRAKHTGEESSYSGGRHNLPIATLGAVIIWGGWYSFNGGSAFAATGQAGLAVVNTHLSACSSGCVWMFLAYNRDRKWHLTEIMNGAFAGLAAVTPGSGFMEPHFAFIVGILAGLGSYGWVSAIKPRLKIDDALDVCALQGVAGIIGSIYLGFFEMPPYAFSVGLAYADTSAEGWYTVGIQVLATCMSILWTGAMTWLLMIFMKNTVGIDTTYEEEELGLDITQMGEMAYDMVLPPLLDLGSDVLTAKLCDACRNGDLKKTRDLIRDGAPPDSADYDLRTPLHLAASEGHVQVLSWLVKAHHLDVNCKDKNGSTPLSDAIRHNHADVVGWLDANGASEVDDVPSLNESDITRAVATGNEVEVGWRLARYERRVAAGAPKEAIEADDPKQADYDRRTPLHVAACNGHAGIATLLMRKDADPNARDRWGRTALDEAERVSQAECVAAIKAFSGGGSKSPLPSIGASPAKKEAAVGVEFGAGSRMLIDSASSGDVREVRASLAKGTDVNIGDYDGRTALHLAANAGHLAVIKVLLKQPRLELDAIDRWGRTPLQDAVEGKHEEIAGLLRAYGATVKDAKMAQALCVAAAAGDTESLARFDGQGVDLNLADYDLRTPLHLAASEGRKATVEWLLGKGARLEPRDVLGATPLDDAKREGHAEVAELIAAALKAEAQNQLTSSTRAGDESGGPRKRMVAVVPAK